MTEERYLACATVKHCEDTALIGTQYSDGDSNGYVDLAINRLSPDQVFILLFSAILFGSIISEDLSEAAVENALLDLFSTNRARLPVAQKLIRLSLRIRQIVLPWFVGAVIIAVLLTDSLAGSDILLNFLAICFLFEADNMLARLLFSHDQMAFVERVLFNDRRRTNDITLNLVWPRLSGLVISLSVVFVVSLMEHLLTLPCYNCNYISQILFNFICIGVLCSGLCWSLGQIREWEIGWAMFLSFLLEFSRSHFAIVVGLSWPITLSLLVIYKQRIWAHYWIQVTVGLAVFILPMMLEIAIAKSHLCYSNKTVRGVLVVSFITLYATMIWNLYNVMTSTI